MVAARAAPDSHRAYGEAGARDADRLPGTVEGAGQFWEFAEWEASMLESEGDALRKWWAEHLRGCRATVVAGMEDEKGRTVRASVGAIRIPDTVRSRCEAAARSAGATLFAVWQAIFAMWAWRAMEAGGEEADDVLVVGPYGRRDELRHQRTVGYFLNMLVYRYPVRRMVEHDAMGLVEMARASTQIIGTAMEKGAAYPFARLLREKRRQRDEVDGPDVCLDNGTGGERREWRGRGEERA